MESYPPALLLLALLALGSCREPYAARAATDRPPPPESPACAEGADCSTPAAVGVGEVATPEGVPLRMTCTPTGPELCFDATDNNCNGVIDEGCGVQTGPLQFSIAWEENGHVDLEVTDPRGELAKPDEPTGSGLTKDRDCGHASSGCRGQNMENVFLVNSKPLPGRYRVELKLDRSEGVRFPLKVRFGGRIGTRTFSTDLELTSSDDAKVFTFLVE